MARRTTLRRRYGRAVQSRISLAAYERELGHALHYLGQRASLVNEDERMMRLRGWENGTKPITLALKIERARKSRRGGR